MSEPDRQNLNDPEETEAQQGGRLIPIARPEVDREFLRRVASEDAVAIEEFLLEHACRLRGHLQARFGQQLTDDRAREEIVLAAVAHAALHVAEAPPPGTPGGVEFWLWRIGSELALARLRAKGADLPGPPSMDEALQAFCDSPDEAAPHPSRAWAESTQVLVEALKQGDQDAWTQLDQTYRTAMQLFIRQRMPGSMQPRLAPEDVFQSAMLRAYNNIGSFEYRGKGSLRAWLARIILHRLHGKYKESHAQRCDVGREEEFSTDLIDMRGTTPEDALMAFRLADVMMAFQKLHPQEQAILTSLIQEKKKTAEIAKQLKVSERTARRRIREAIERLAGCLEE